MSNSLQQQETDSSELVEMTWHAAQHSQHEAIVAWCAEHVQMACQIITSCVLLGQASFLQHHASAVVRSLQALIGITKSTAILFPKTCVLSSCASPPPPRPLPSPPGPL